MKFNFKQNWKKVALGGTALLAVATLAACGSGASASKANAKANLSFWWWGSADRNTATQKQIDNFQKSNPNITVKGRPTGFGNLDQVFATQYAGGTSADVLTLLYNWVPMYGQNGGFYDLSKIKSLDLKDNYDASFLKFGQVDGKQVAVPYGQNVMVMWVNKTVYEKFGVDVSKLHTWQDYINAAKKFPKGYYPLCSPTWNFMPTIYLQQLTGKTEFDAKGNLNWSENDIEQAVSWYYSLVKDGVMVPADNYIANVGSDPVSLANNKMELNGNYAGGVGWNAGLQADHDALAAKGDDMEIVPYPVIDNAKGANILSKPSLLLAIKKDEKNPEQAGKYLNDFLNGKKANQILGTTRGVPASKSAVKALTDNGQLTGFAKSAYEAGLNVKTMNETPFYEDGTLTQIWTQQAQAVELGKQDVKTAAKNIYTQTKAQAAKLAVQYKLTK
ncbi:ABC transporter substrate-binding protein [Lactococcus protaetiae]|uniref:Carbohydrate ABC transporter substrate-binding protein n=1 Tax=Lactococcus protaetiae TaxID=2592653 RepID=A0A514Z8P7_9LACT|nr:extracellular solute-binding protein [Lactococcus protaetiae]MCL2112663.1 carbohydrate ABC transporter substrate-binding protein [Streptococcaceae bacterium]QDK70961.1 carbohydrate ABC transporter substrate-binding protein [Lactococcus protaetiae]